MATKAATTVKVTIGKDEVEWRPGPVNLPASTWHSIKVQISGDLLVVKALDQKTADAMEDKRKGGAAPAKKPIDPEDLFERARYRIAGKDAFKAMSIKHAIETAATEAGEHATKIRRGIHVHGNAGQGEFCIIEHNKKVPSMRVDDVRNEHSGVPMKAYRPEYLDWSTEIVVEFNAALYSLDRVMRLIMESGNCGICEGRPSKSGMRWGRYTIATAIAQ